MKRSGGEVSCENTSTACLKEWYWPTAHKGAGGGYTTCEFSFLRSSLFVRLAPTARCCQELQLKDRPFSPPFLSSPSFHWPMLVPGRHNCCDIQKLPEAVKDLITRDWSFSIGNLLRSAYDSTFALLFALLWRIFFPKRKIWKKLREDAEWKIWKRQETPKLVQLSGWVIAP